MVNHIPDSDNKHNSKQKLPKVIVIGGGFGGLYTARYLKKYAKRKLDIELISERNYFVFQPMLPEVAAGNINAQDAVSPLRSLLPGIRVRLGEVTKVDFKKQTLYLLQGKKRTLIPQHYDHLVLATGQITDLGRLPGFSEHSLCLRDTADAFLLRNRIIKCLETADVSIYEDIKRAALCFVVVGGGFSGVETVGEVAEMIRRSVKYYPNINPADLDIVLMQKGSTILPELAPTLGERTLKKLRKRGVRFLLDTGASSATANSITTDTGITIKTSTIVTTVGNGPSPFIKSMNLPMYRGRIQTDSYLRVLGYDNVWAVGDAALTPLAGSDAYAPPTAQFAVREAARLGANIAASVEQKPLINFVYKPRGAMASIGHYYGVVEIFGIKISGVLAWFLWRGFYLSMLPGLATRIRVAVAWMLDYFLPRTIATIQQPEVPACHYIHYAKDDEVFARGQFIEGFYTVVKGSFEMRIKEPNGEYLIKTLRQGSHWGERILEFDGIATGTVTALEDSVVLLLNKNDFFKLSTAFKPFRDYIESIDDSHYSQNVQKLAANRLLKSDDSNAKNSA